MPPSASPGGWTRRRVLAAGLVVATAAGATAGCGIDLGAVRRDDVPPPQPPVPGPDDLARAQAVDTATRLRDAARAGSLASAERPDLAAALVRVAADHDAHLAQLGPPPPGATATAPAGTAAPGSSPTAGSPTAGSPTAGSPTAGSPTSSGGGPGSTATTPQPDLDPVAAAAAEQAGALEALTAVATTPGPLARLLTAVAASRAGHAVELSAALGVPAPAQPPTPLGVAGAIDAPTPPAVDVGAPSAAAGEALLAIIDGEHAAAYAYGVLAVRLVDEPRAAAVAAIDRHQRAAARLADLATGAGHVPRPPEPAYAVPAVPDAAAATTLAAELELALATAATVVVERTDGDLRSLAADVTITRALASQAWRGPLPALPGLAEHRS